MDKKWMILTCFFSVLTFISSIICSCLVFYNEKARTEINSNKVLATSNTYKSATILYNQNNYLSISGLIPGNTIEQSFSITNNNSNTIIYDIEWDNVTTTWNYNNDGLASHPEEFSYALTCSNGEKVENKVMPVDSNDYTIFSNLELKTNKSNECDIKITFINTGNDQSYNLNKSFSGIYKVVVRE